MKRIRIAVAIVASVACVLATAGPSAAYYRETADPAHDLAAGRQCAGIPRTASVDIREIGASTTEGSRSWRLRVTMRVADLSKPVYRQRQVFEWAAYDRGDLAFTVRVSRSVNRHGKLATWAMLGSNSVPVRVRGDTVTVRAAVLAGRRLQVKGSARIEKAEGYRVVCTVRDATGRIGPLPTS